MKSDRHGVRHRRVVLQLRMRLSKEMRHEEDTERVKLWEPFPVYFPEQVLQGVARSCPAVLVSRGPVD